MVIDQARRLHEGIADCRTDKLEAAFFEGFAHGVRFAGRGGDVFEGPAPVADSGPADKLPDIGIEGAKFLLDLKEGTRVGHCGFNFEAVANDARIVEQ